jgi:acyl transferase domain-containing protein
VERLAEGRAAAEVADGRPAAGEVAGAGEPSSQESALPESALPEPASPEPASPEPASPEALASLTQAWVAGSAVDWEPAFAELDARPVRLPTYAFARRRHWVEHSPLWEAGGPIAQMEAQAPPPAAPVGSAPIQDEV